MSDLQPEQLAALVAIHRSPFGELWTRGHQASCAGKYPLKLLRELERLELLFLDHTEDDDGAIVRYWRLTPTGRAAAGAGR